MKKEAAFHLAVRMETFVMNSNEPSKGFCYPLVVDMSFSLKDFLGALCSKFSWSQVDSVQVK